MSIETQRLRLLPYRMAATPDGGFMIVREDGEEFAVPAEFQDHFRLVQNGLTLAQIAKGLKTSHASGKFKSLARFLEFLGDAGLLADRGALRLAESLRSEYRWPESIAFEELFGVSLFDLPRSRPSVVLAWATALLLVVTGSACVAGLALLIAGKGIAFGDLPGPFSPGWLKAFLFVFVLGRGLKAIAQLVALRMTTGERASLRLRLEPLCITLSSNDLSRAAGNWPLILGGVGASLMLTAPAALMTFFGERFGVSDWSGAVLVFSFALLLADLSPFVQSAATSLLRSLYGLLDRARKETGDKSDHLESSMKTIHVATCVVWCLALGFYLVGPFGAWLEHMRGHFEAGALKTGWIWASLLILSQGILLFSWINDLASAVRYGQGSDQRLVRKLWSRKQRGIRVEEALRSGRDISKAQLEQLPFLRQLDPDLRSALLANAVLREVEEGKALCKQGGTDRSLFMVLDGRLAVARRAEGHKNQRRKVVAWLAAGSAFGEAAFFFGQARTADVVAMEPSLVLEIRHEPDMKSMSGPRSEELQLRIWFLQSLMSGSFLRDLPSEALDALLFAGRKKTFSAGVTVIREGEDGDACYFIVQGQATVLQNGRTINKVKAGDAFGEIALIKPYSPRTASVTADSDLITIAVDGEKFWDLLASHLPLAIEIERLAEARLLADRERVTKAAS